MHHPGHHPHPQGQTSGSRGGGAGPQRRQGHHCEYQCWSTVGMGGERYLGQFRSVLSPTVATGQCLHCIHQVLGGQSVCSLMQKWHAVLYPSPIAGLTLNHAWLIQQQRVVSNVKMIHHGRLSYGYCHAKYSLCLNRLLCQTRLRGTVNSFWQTYELWFHFGDSRLEIRCFTACGLVIWKWTVDPLRLSSKII